MERVGVAGGERVMSTWQGHLWVGGGGGERDGEQQHMFITCQERCHPWDDREADLYLLHLSFWTQWCVPVHNTQQNTSCTAATKHNIFNRSCTGHKMLNTQYIIRQRLNISCTQHKAKCLMYWALQNADYWTDHVPDTKCWTPCT